MGTDILPLDIQNISKSFAGQTILNDISLSVKQGEIFGLIALNGVGKTTLIKIILDLITQDIGKASFFGVDHKNTHSREDIAYLPEKFYPSQFLTGEEFLSLSLAYQQKKYDANLAAFYANKLDLKVSKLSEKISKYSKGMGQKLGILSIVLSQAPLLILDEPMSGLDPRARIQLKNMLLDYVADNHKSIFFTSHILSDIDEICHRIAVIDQGNLVFLGTPARFKSHYNEDNLEQAFIKSITSEVVEG